MGVEWALQVVAAGAAAIGIAALLWALRVTDGARGMIARWKGRVQELEDKLARADGVFAAHPGVVLIWEERQGPTEDTDWGTPRLYGSALALASLLRFSDSAVAAEPGVRILQGLSGFEAEDATGGVTRLSTALARLRREGTPFSLTISTTTGMFVEVDGRTAGARVVVWIVDESVRGLEESAGRGRVREARQVIARDPAAFLEMLAHGPFLAWRLSGAMKLEWANPAYLEAVESRTVDQAIGRNVQLDQATVDQAKRAFEQGAALVETRNVVIRGELRSMRVEMFPVSDGVGALAFDVTDSEKLRVDLDRHRAAHDKTLNHLTEAVAIFGPDKRLVFYNFAFERLWGLDPAFLADRPTHAQWLDHLKERRKLPAHANYAEWRASELALYQEVAELPEDLWVLQETDPRTLRVARQRHPMGGLLLIFSDITDQLKLRAQYQGQLQTQQAVLDRLHEGVAVFGLDGRLRLRNAAFAGTWGLTPADLEGDVAIDRVIDLCQPLFHDRAVWGQIRERITDPSPQSRQEHQGRMARSDGTVVTYLTRPLPDGATLVTFLDVTADTRVSQALHDRAEALEAADRLKSQFVQNVSHQLRNPLQAIMMNADMMRNRLFGPLNDRQAEQVDDIVTATEGLSELVTNILDLANIEAGTAPLDLRPVDVRAAIEDSIQLATSQAKDTEVQIKIDCPTNVGVIEADESRVKQVLVHLLGNALRFTQRGDQITVGAQRLEGMARLWVSDTGPGIPYESQAGAFESFQSGDRNGAGLGLALVKSFVRMHGGWVSLKSAPGEGTTVTCHLPLVSPQSLPNPPLPNPPLSPIDPNSRSSRQVA